MQKDRRRIVTHTKMRTETMTMMIKIATALFVATAGVVSAFTATPQVYVRHFPTVSVCKNLCPVSHDDVAFFGRSLYKLLSSPHTHLLVVCRSFLPSLLHNNNNIIIIIQNRNWHHVPRR